MITLYSTGCPKCKVLKLKLDSLKLNYDVIEDLQTVVAFGKEHNISAAPILQVDEDVYNFSDAIKWINNTKKGE